MLEPDREATIQILLGTIPKIEYKTGIKMIENGFIRRLLMESIVDATSQYKRVYGLSAMYPDVSLSVLSGSFSNALFENKPEVGILDVYIAIRDSKRIILIVELRSVRLLGKSSYVFVKIRKLFYLMLKLKISMWRMSFNL